MTFYCGLRELGMVHFSEFTMRRQQMAYGIDWGDCLTYDSNGQECVGDPALEGDTGGKYEPLWDRGLERARELLTKVKATQNPHRLEYDLSKVERLVELLERCATSPLRKYCRVRIS